MSYFPPLTVFTLLYTLCLDAETNKQIKTKISCSCENFQAVKSTRVHWQSKFVTDLTSSSRDTTLLQHPIKTRTMAKPVPMMLHGLNKLAAKCVTSWSGVPIGALWQINCGVCFIRALRLPHKLPFQLNTSESVIALFLIPRAHGSCSSVWHHRKKKQVRSVLKVVCIWHDVTD